MDIAEHFPAGTKTSPPCASACFAAPQGNIRRWYPYNADNCSVKPAAIFEDDFHICCFSGNPATASWVMAVEDMA